MDQLPITLLSLFNTVVEQYKEFSWSSQEQNGKMRITLTWTNDTQIRPKSKSTKVRDRKRYEQFRAQKQKIAEKDEQRNEKVSSDEEDISSDSESDNEMDIVDNPITLCDASTQVNILPDGKRSIKRTINTAGIKPCQQVNKAHDINKVKDSIITNRPSTQEYPTNESKEKKQIPTWPRKFFRKIVMKTTRGIANTLIGQIPGHEFLVEHLISEKQTDLINTRDPEYQTYYKNITDDFDDVKDTDFMDESVKNAIQLMENYVEHVTNYRK